MVALPPSICEASTRNKLISFENVIQLRRNPIKMGNWEADPSIVICNSSVASLSDVESSIEWWKSLGYSFGQIIVNEPGQICHQSGENGFITIEGPDSYFDFDYLAITHRKSSQDEILSARIVLRGQNEKTRILEHEIGHALGWSHCNRRGHIMNPEWSRGGWDDDGLMLDN